MMLLTIAAAAVTLSPRSSEASMLRNEARFKVLTGFLPAGVFRVLISAAHSSFPSMEIQSGLSRLRTRESLIPCTAKPEQRSGVEPRTRNRPRPYVEKCGFFPALSLEAAQPDSATLPTSIVRERLGDGLAALDAAQM